MNKQTARKIADTLTWMRIWMVLPISLCAWYGLQWWVFWLYIFASLTDLADGKFARRAAPPKSDIDFDGYADLVLILGTLLWIWWLVPGFYERYFAPYFWLFIVLEIVISAVRIRCPKMKIPHYQFGRFVMVVFCCLLPGLLLWGDTPGFAHLILTLGVLSKIQQAAGLLIAAKSYLNGTAAPSAE